jgi:hypothetical protein
MDTTVKAMWYGLVTLMLLGMVSAILFCDFGSRFAVLVEAALLLTAGFALIGVALGMIRSLKNAKAL